MMTNATMKSVLARMATDASFARSVREHVGVLTSEYGLSPDEASTVASLTIDTRAVRPRRLEERLSRSSFVGMDLHAGGVDAGGHHDPGSAAHDDGGHHDDGGGGRHDDGGGGRHDDGGGSPREGHTTGAQREGHDSGTAHRTEVSRQGHDSAADHRGSGGDRGGVQGAGGHHAGDGDHRGSGGVQHAEHGPHPAAGNTVAGGHLQAGPHPTSAAHDPAAAPSSSGSAPTFSGGVRPAFGENAPPANTSWQAPAVGGFSPAPAEHAPTPFGSFRGPDFHFPQAPAQPVDAVGHPQHPSIDHAATPVPPPDPALTHPTHTTNATPGTVASAGSPVPSDHQTPNDSALAHQLWQVLGGTPEADSASSPTGDEAIAHHIAQLVAASLPGAGGPANVSQAAASAQFLAGALHIDPGYLAAPGSIPHAPAHAAPVPTPPNPPTPTPVDAARPPDAASAPIAQLVSDLDSRGGTTSAASDPPSTPGPEVPAGPQVTSESTGEVGIVGAEEIRPELATAQPTFTDLVAANEQHVPDGQGGFTSATVDHEGLVVQVHQYGDGHRTELAQLDDGSVRLVGTDPQGAATTTITSPGGAQHVHVDSVEGSWDTTTRTDGSTEQSVTTVDGHWSHTTLDATGHGTRESDAGTFDVERGANGELWGSRNGTTVWVEDAGGHEIPPSTVEVGELTVPGSTGAGSLRSRFFLDGHIEVQDTAQSGAVVQKWTFTSRDEWESVPITVDEPANTSTGLGSYDLIETSHYADGHTSQRVTGGVHPFWHDWF